jgi:beta-lactamase class D
MAKGAKFLILSAVAAAIAAPAGPLRAQGPNDLRSAFGEAFAGVEACAALRDVAPGAQAALSDEAVCGRRLPPCATFDVAATVIALDRGVAPDALAPVKRNPPVQGDPPDGVNLRDAMRQPVPWVYEEIARRIGADAFAKSLGAMRYGNAESGGPLERIGRGGGGRALALSAVEQLDFLARLKRGELPTSAESQARTVETLPVERAGDVPVVVKTGACDGAAWAIGWVERGERSTLFAVVESNPAPDSANDVAARTRRLLQDLALTPAAPR